jgi:U3 small nucleolar RNA-associated protein 10
MTRVHEHNTEDVLFAFLPYHSTPIFTVLLSIVPEKITPTFRFLRPYVNSPTNPPMHTIIHAATNTPQFFSAFNNHVIRIARHGHQSEMLLSFWCSVTSQSLEGILFASESGIPALRKQRLESALLQILPVLNDALSVKDEPEMGIGACMMTTILTSRAPLGDTVIAQLMDAVAVTWIPGTDQWSDDARLISLAALAQDMSTGKLSRAVTKRLLQLPDLIDHLVAISGSYKTDKLMTGLALRCVDRFSKSRNESDLNLVSDVLNSRVLKEKQVVKVITKLFEVVSRLLKSSSEAPVTIEIPLWSRIGRIVDFLSKSRYAPALKSVSQNPAVDLTPLQGILQSVVDDVQPAQEDVKMIDAPSESEASDVVKILSLILDDGSSAHSFFETPGSALYEKLVQTLRIVGNAPGGMKSFVEHPALREKTYTTDPAFLTFMVSVASADMPYKIRKSALAQIKKHVSAARSPDADFHVLLPYLLAGLTDNSDYVRVSVSDIISSICSSSSISDRNVSQTWGSTSLYSHHSEHYSLSKTDAEAFCSLLLSSLEDLPNDAFGLFKILRKGLSKPKSKSKSATKHGLSTQSREAILDFIATHAVETNLLRVKVELLEFLSSMGRASSKARSEIVMPAFRKWITTPTEVLEPLHKTQDVRLWTVMKAFLRCITPKDGVGLDFMFEVLEGRVPEAHSISALKSRIADIWPSLALEHRSKILKLVLETGLGSSNAATTREHSETASTLHSMPLLPDDLELLLEMLPSASPITSSSASKRRRVTRSESSKFEQSPHETMRALDRYAVVLDVIYESRPQKHPYLLKGLFSVLGELQTFGVQTDSHLGYLKSLTVMCLLQIVDKLKVSSPYNGSCKLTIIGYQRAPEGPICRPD